MRAHVLQHVPFEGLGSIENWLNQRKAAITYTQFFASAPLPALSEVDLVIAMGGPMSVNDEQEFLWLRDEKRFVAEAIAAGKPVLGICLGSQLIANVLGSRVYPGPQKEIGWFPIYAEPSPPGAFTFPETVEVFHWHGETYDLPPGAVHLAHSAVCRHQAFQFGERVIGLQFHLETTPESADAIITNCADELVPQPYIQTESALRAVPSTQYAGINALMAEVLSYLVR